MMLNRYPDALTHRAPWTLSAIVLLLGGGGLIAAPQGTITALTLSPVTAEVGAVVTATATGSAGGCGAVHIDWGDGNAITYATEILPVAQKHIYKTVGTYNLRAQGMGNCTGEARARVVITAPPPPPPAPAPPKPAPPKEVVAPPPPRPRQITGLDAVVPPEGPAGVRALTVLGNGRCAYTLDYGDGNTETRESALPETVRHNYPAEGRYTAVVTARAPCSGVMRSTFIIGRSSQPEVPVPPGSIARVEVRPQVAGIGERIAVTIAGSGTCKFVIDFGDGEVRTIAEALPHRLIYQYARAGNHEISVAAQLPCSGSGEALLRVRRR